MGPDARAIKELVTAEGIDLVGIADARELLLSYPPRPATSLLPEAGSVIVMAVAHSRGAVQAPLRLWTRNKMETSRLLDRTAEKIARGLEKQGFLSLPVSADKPVEIFKRDPVSGRRFRHARVSSDLSLKHAAVSAGIGEIGRSNLLLTPEFGPHQRLGAIVTSAVLEPDPAVARELCGNCSRCEKACPVGALEGGRHDVDRCFNYWSSGLKMLRPADAAAWPAYLRLILRESRSRALFTEVSQNYITDVDYCIECMKACPVGSTTGTGGSDDRQ